MRIFIPATRTDGGVQGLTIVVSILFCAVMRPLPLEFLVSQRAFGLYGDVWYVWTPERCCDRIILSRSYYIFFIWFHVFAISFVRSASPHTAMFLQGLGSLCWWRITQSTVLLIRVTITSRRFLKHSSCSPDILCITLSMTSLICQFLYMYWMFW